MLTDWILTLYSAEAIIVPHRIIWSWYTGRWSVGCYIWYSEEGTGRDRSPLRPLLAVPNVTAHPSTASVPITVLLYNGPLFCGFDVTIKGLKSFINGIFYAIVQPWAPQTLRLLSIKNLGLRDLLRDADAFIISTGRAARRPACRYCVYSVIQKCSFPPPRGRCVATINVKFGLSVQKCRNTPNRKTMEFWPQNCPSEATNLPIFKRLTLR